MKKYFKVHQDFSRYIPIEEEEYEKAIFAFLKGRPAVFENGAVSRIEGIFPDLNKMNGWYSDYKPNQDDNAEIENAREIAGKFTAKIKDKVQYLIDTNQEHLIGKNVEIPELEKPQRKEISEATKQLSDKFKI